MVHYIASLSKGAEAGIGAGAALAAVVIIALLVWVILLRKRSRYHGQARNVAGGQDSSMLSKGLPEGAGGNGVSKHEMSGYARPHEMEVM